MFPPGIPHERAGAHVFLSRSPLTTRRPRVRLACIRHAASVDPEPGSNSSSLVERQSAAPRSVRSEYSQVTHHTSVGQVRRHRRQKIEGVTHTPLDTLPVVGVCSYEPDKKCCRFGNEVKCTIDTRTCQVEIFDLFIPISQGCHERCSLTTGGSLPHKTALSSESQISIFGASGCAKPNLGA